MQQVVGQKILQAQNVAKNIGTLNVVLLLIVLLMFVYVFFYLVKVVYDREMNEKFSDIDTYKPSKDYFGCSSGSVAQSFNDKTNVSMNSNALSEAQDNLYEQLGYIDVNDKEEYEIVGK